MCRRPSLGSRRARRSCDTQRRAARSGEATPHDSPPWPRPLPPHPYYLQRVGEEIGDRTRVEGLEGRSIDGQEVEDAGALVLRRVPCAAVDRGGNLVVGGTPVALDQEALVLGVQDGLLVVLAGERLERLDRVPQRDHDELGAIAGLPAKHPGAAVSPWPRSRRHRLRACRRRNRWRPRFGRRLSRCGRSSVFLLVDCQRVRAGRRHAAA